MAPLSRVRSRPNSQGPSRPADKKKRPSSHRQIAAAGPPRWLQHGAIRLQARRPGSDLPQVHLRRLRGEAGGSSSVSSSSPSSSLTLVLTGPSRSGRAEPVVVREARPAVLMMAVEELTGWSGIDPMSQKGMHRHSRVRGPTLGGGGQAAWQHGAIRLQARRPPAMPRSRASSQRTTPARRPPGGRSSRPACSASWRAAASAPPGPTRGSGNWRSPGSGRCRARSAGSPVPNPSRARNCTLPGMFAKHGLSRQSELVRLVLSLAGAPEARR